MRHPFVFYVKRPFNYAQGDKNKRYSGKPDPTFGWGNPQKQKEIPANAGRLI
jgi:hypothetical protein